MILRLSSYASLLHVFQQKVGFFETYVKKEKILTLEQAVYKTSTQTAKRFNLKGRGIIQKGSYADIVLMDLEKLKVNGTPLEPKKKPQGIEYVIINGKIVVKKGVHKGALPGKILKRANN